MRKKLRQISNVDHYSLVKKALKKHTKIKLDLKCVAKNVIINCIKNLHIDYYWGYHLQPGSKKLLFFFICKMLRHICFPKQKHIKAHVFCTCLEALLNSKNM
jgi:hypothetical protein